jgi:PilZ domain
MLERYGRLEKRIRLAVPVEISTLKDPPATECTSTENVCSLGVRVLTQRRREPDEQLMVRFIVGPLRSVARVVYCERLADGRFGVGMQFLGIRARWRADLVGAGPGN